MSIIWTGNTNLVNHQTGEWTDAIAQSDGDQIGRLLILLGQEILRNLLTGACHCDTVSLALERERSS